ncbi:DUF1993 domain-containing protein [Sphingobium sp. DEHP117]|uniref:DUF1993 domain-containing protein n=1 Tax=Sphingobium sp. DEHP117 TaxID=2993436 RepID=UPI0027D50EEB|nr:DUF1993 family protein [Sphingobium sp. DEHP117]MDQ4421775.1 DUF1993 domain-containing protein [Sphingobium sp. DEHP117]
MPIFLYDATIPCYLQILEAGLGLIDKAQAFCADNDVAEEALLAEHFGADMLPLAMQLKWMTTHSLGAIEGVRAGKFSPERSAPAETFSAFREQMSATIAALKAIAPEEIESFVGRDMVFEVPAMNVRMDFTAESFLLSFSLPNFYFHATTAYDILRHKGVDIGKRDFLGVPRLKAPA